MQVEKITLKNKQENPFSGMRHCLYLYQNADKIVTETMIQNAFIEASTKEQREMFYSLLFSIGDITARNHKIFNNDKVDTGGSASRQNFITVLKWMKKTVPKQYIKFLFANLFNEYTNFDNLLGMRVKTQKGKKKIIEVINMTEGIEQELAQYIAKIINGKDEFDKQLVSKFLTRPRTSKRKVKLQDITKINHKKKSDFIRMISDLVGWDYVDHGNWTEYVGFYQWKKKYNEDLESVVFSSKRILEFDREQFIKWIDKLPSDARFRVRKRLMDGLNKPKEKWPAKYTEWFLDWEKSKEKAQDEQRILEEKVRQNTATTDDLINLEKVKKEAKVTTGAINFKELFQSIVTGTVDKIKIQPFLDKVNLPFNNLVIVDDSGSMQSNYGSTFGFTAFQFAAFMATICLIKNPTDEGRRLMGMFSERARFYTSVDERSTSKNRFVSSGTEKVNEPLIDPEKHFLENLTRIQEFMKSKQTGNSTNISSVPESLNEWVNSGNRDENLELLMAYPVWTFISDGNFNNRYNSTTSMLDFMAKCEKYFGFRPFVILIDVSGDASADIGSFENIENVIVVQPNPSQIELLLTNFKDVEIADVYQSLWSLHKSNRYDLVRKFVN
jgi:hypothetical protein